MILLVVGCSNTALTTTNSTKDKIVIEQYFYSHNEETLNRLAQKLRTKGYKINDYKSIDLESAKEWFFYSSKEIIKQEIDEEDLISEHFAKTFNVKYDGHGFSIE